MQFRQIRFFLSVAKHLNFTTAADECAVSQPALSKAIQKLEEDLGQTLLERNSQQVRLTDFGRIMHTHFESIEGNVRRARSAAIDAANSDVSRLNVGVMCTIGPRRFAPFLDRVRIDHPDTEINLHDVLPGVIPELLITGALDAVFCARTTKHDQRFLAVDLFSERMCVAFAAGHRFTDFETVPLAEIAKETYLDRLNCEFRDEFLDFTKSSGLNLNVVVRSEREDWILELVAQGSGVCVLPSSSAGASLVAHRPIADMERVRNLELVMLADAHHSASKRALLEAAQSFAWE